MEKILFQNKIKKINKLPRIIIFSCFFVLISVFSGIKVQSVNAASLYFSPSSGSSEVGKNFSVSIYVSSPDQAINAASGVISFPQDKLTVVSVSKSGSIFSLWTQEPSFSGDSVSFEGIILNPGFKGSSGKIITINFKTKAAGKALITFSSGSILANDGQGTNILSLLGGATFNLGAAATAPPTPQKTTAVPAAPKIISSTHPDQNKWYISNNPKFSWPAYLGITAARLLVGQIPQAVPTVLYIPAISSKELINLEDGIWYFHVQLKNAAGWGGTAHFRVQIDSEKPSRLDVQEIKRDDQTVSKVKFNFDAQDTTSGIDHYEIKIDGSEPQMWTNNDKGVFETPALKPDEHTLTVKAIDKAGNFLEKSVQFTVAELEPPIITEYPQILQNNEVAVINGTVQPNVQLVLWWQKEGENAENQSIENTNDGIFTFIKDKFKAGAYKLWAEAIGDNGTQRISSEKSILTVKEPVALKIKFWSTNCFEIIILFTILLIVFLIIFMRGRRKFFLFKTKIKHKVREAGDSLRETFDSLKKIAREQIEILEKIHDKHRLIAEEEMIIKRIKKELDIAEKSIKKNIKKIDEKNNL